MLTLTETQRVQLLDIVSGKEPGSYFAASIVLQLADGREPSAIAKASFCEAEEVETIATLFQQRGVEAVQNFEG